MSEETALLTCPFCGSEMHFVPTDQPNGWRVYGRHTTPCPFSMLVYDDCTAFVTREAAAKSWNTRAELGNGTCELVETDSYSNANEVIHVLECSKCGRTCEHVNGSYPRCPHCGAPAKEDGDDR